MARPEYNRDWPALRLRMLERDLYLCQIQGPTCKRTATEVDHIIPVGEGGSWRDPANLRSVCKPCHNRRQVRHITVLPTTKAEPSRIW